MRSFYDTYEELKLGTSVPNILLKSCFYDTYEELKLGPYMNGQRYLYRMFLRYLWGIETLSSILNFLIQNSVFTIPMRNWNIQNSVKSFSQLTFLRYLWGIETDNKRTNGESCWSFYDTYEELKPPLYAF